MGISNLFSAADVILDVSASNKRNLLEIMATRLQAGSGVPGRRSSRPCSPASRSVPRLSARASHFPMRNSAVPIRRSCFSPGSVVRSTSMLGMTSRSIWFFWCSGRRRLARAFCPPCLRSAGRLREPQSLRRLRLAETPEDVVQLVHQLDLRRRPGRCARRRHDQLCARKPRRAGCQLRTRGHIWNARPARAIRREAGPGRFLPTCA